MWKWASIAVSNKTPPTKSKWRGLHLAAGWGLLTPAPEHPPFGLLCQHPVQRRAESPSPCTKWWPQDQTRLFSLLTPSSPLIPPQGFCLYDCRGAGQEGISVRGAEPVEDLSTSPTTRVQSPLLADLWRTQGSRGFSVSLLHLSLENDKSPTQPPVTLSLYHHVLFCEPMILRMKTIQEWRNTVVAHQGQLI